MFNTKVNALVFLFGHDCGLFLQMVEIRKKKGYIYMRCGCKFPRMSLLQIYFCTYNVMRGVTFNVVLLTSQKHRPASVRIVCGTPIFRPTEVLSRFAEGLTRLTGHLQPRRNLQIFVHCRPNTTESLQYPCYRIIIHWIVFRQHVSAVMRPSSGL
jgi:hypothetical protein